MASLSNIGGMISEVQQKLLPIKDGNVDLAAVFALVSALFLLIVPLDLSQLAFTIAGAAAYAALQASRKVTKQTFKNATTPRKKIINENWKAPKAPTVKTTKACAVDPSLRSKKTAAGWQEYRQPSTQPVSAPEFANQDYEAQVQELVTKISPSSEGDKLVADIVATAKKTLRNFVPEATVMGFASGDVLRGTAFAVAIPEVDVILSASPAVLVERLMTRPNRGGSSRPSPHVAQLDPRKLQKTMLRACTDELTATASFKFRRSAFKGLEPKVTLMAEIGGKSTPIDFSVNTITPLYHAAMLKDCGQIEPLTKQLILLIRRWAKDRGISHAAKGHLSPYCWTILVIYFLQVWNEHGEPMLPKLAEFKTLMEFLRTQQTGQQELGFNAMKMPFSSDRLRSSKTSSSGQAGTHGHQPVSVAELFRAFVRFFNNTFNWSNEAISILAGQRAPPAYSLPIHTVVSRISSTAVAPSIQDPFEPTRNLSDGMTGLSLERLREELRRADRLCAEGAPLRDIIEPWVPPDADPGADGAASSDS